MFAKNYWSHYGPDGATPWDFILASGYQYEYAGENLAKNFMFTDGVLDAWKNSPTHRENIMKGDYTEVGFAVVNGVLNGEETTLVVQLFGRPLNSSFSGITAKAETPLPTPTPKAESPLKSPAPTQPQEELLKSPTILAQTSPQKKSSILPFTLGSNVIFLAFFLLALILDFYFASKLHIVRITGKNLAHIIFVGFIIVGLLFLTKGSIL